MEAGERERYLDLLVEDLLLLLVEDVLLLGVLQEALVLLGGVHFLQLLALLQETHRDGGLNAQAIKHLVCRGP